MDPRLSAVSQFSEAIIESSFDGIFAYDLECRYVAWNPAMEAISGIPREACVGQVAFEVFPFLIEIGEAEYFHRALAGQVVKTEHRPYRVPATGRSGFFKAQYAPLYDADRQIVGGLAIIRDVTDEVQTAEKLRDQAHRFLAAFDHMGLAACICDLEGRLVYANPALHAMLGYDPGELTGTAWHALFVPEEAEEEQAVFRALRTTGKTSHQAEKRLRRKDGTLRWGWCNLSRVQDERGVPDAVVALIPDVTLHKQTQRDLLKQGEQFRLFFEHAPIGNALVGAEGRYTAVNQAFCDMLGYREDELLGLTYRDITHPDDLVLSRMFVDRLRQGDSPLLQGEKRYVHKSGRVVWGLLNTIAIRDAAGNCQYFVNQIVDITARKAAQDQLQRSETMLKLAQKISSTGSWTWVRETSEVTWSDEMYRLHGLDPATFVPAPEAIAAFLSEDDRRQMREMIQTLLETGKEQRFEYTIRRPDGQRLLVQGEAGLIQTAPDAPVSILGTMQDVTEEREIQEAFRKMSERFATIFHAAPIGIVLVSEEEHLVREVNERFTELSGYTMLELGGLPLRQCNLFRDFDVTAHLNSEAAQRGHLSEVEVLLQRKSGAARDVLLSVAHMAHTASGEASGIVLMMADLSEHKAMADALRDAQEWIELIMNHVPLSMTWKNRDLVYIGANHVGLLHTGAHTLEALIGLKEPDLPCTPDDPEAAEEWDRRVIETGNPILFLIERMRMEDGVERWYNTNRVPLKGAEGDVLGVLITREDITGLIQAGELLRQSEERYRSFIQTISEAICCFEMTPGLATSLAPEAQMQAIYEEARIADHNDVYLQLFTRPEAQASPPGRMRDVHPWSDSLKMLLHTLVHAGYQVQNAHFRVEGADGNTQHFLVNMVGMVVQDRVERIWMSAINITESYELKYQMVDLLELQLQRLGRELHDGVGQLLTGMRMMGEQLEELLAREEHPLATRAQRIATFARNALEQTRDIYRGLTPVQLRYEGLMAALEDLAAKACENLDIACTCHVDPAADVVDADRAIHLYRIAQEAVTNAIKHGRARTIEITLRPEDDFSLLMIHDDGEGFETEQPSRRGLGLSGMRYRAAVVNAWFNVTSVPGAGTTVRCLFS